MIFTYWYFADPYIDEESAEFTEEYDEDEDSDFPDPEESSQEEILNLNLWARFCCICHLDNKINRVSLYMLETHQKH